MSGMDVGVPYRRDLSLEEAETSPLVEGDVICPIDGSAGIDNLEAVLVDHVYPGERQFFKVELPLSRAIHPSRYKDVRFRGQFHNGFGAIQETDLELLSRRLRGKHLEPQQTLTTIIGMELHSTGRGFIGMLMREVIYFQRAVANGEHVGRYVVGAALFGDNGVEAVKGLQQDAQARAEKWAKWALEHPLMTTGSGDGSRRGRGSVYGRIDKWRQQHKHD